MRHISSYLSGRDNNFNLIRFLAAGAVVLAHSYIVASGDKDTGPLIASTGHDLGYHAVNVFFVASGFLIAQSWAARPSLPHFLAGRLLRLWPALTVCALVVVFVVGPLATSLPLGTYFDLPSTYAFVPKVMGLIQADSSLPGIVTTLHDDQGIDAPLWTLKYEVFCYLSLAVLGLIGGLSSPSRFWRWIAPIMMLLVASSLLPIAHDVTHPFIHLVRFGLCFGFGVSAFIFRDRVPMSAFGIVGFFLLAVLLRQTLLYEVALCSFTAYATLWAAFVPASFIRQFNRLGDYSYGIYIFAYPIQQMFAIRHPRLSPLDLFAIVAPMVLAIAAASWHFIERPSLTRKADLARVFARFKYGRKDPGSTAHRPSADLPDRASA
ncbi:MAG TPA: acyltransferase [Parvibaculum sp.]